MTLSSKSITAIKLFIDLGENFGGDFISLIDIARRKEISKKFLEQIIPLFKNSKLLIASRGNKGGYKLGVSPTEINLYDILSITEPSLFSKNKDLVIGEAFNELDIVIIKYLSSITVEKLIKTQIDSYTYNYCI